MLDTTRPFLRAAAIAAGVSRTRLSGPSYRRILPRVYISSDALPRPEQRYAGALLVHPGGAWLSHTTAASMYGVAVPDDSSVHVSVRRARDRRPMPGLKTHVAPPKTETRLVRGLPVSSPVRLLVELAALLCLVDLVVAGDSILRQVAISRAELVCELDQCRDYWSTAARRAAAYVRDEVDSAMESRLRMLIVLAGLLEPEVNWKIYDESGELLYRLDLAYPWLKIAIEYDGKHHASTWTGDVKRREYLDRHGWRVITVVAADIYSTPEVTLARICDVLHERGYVVPPLDDSWRQHFPGRRRSA